MVEEKEVDQTNPDNARWNLVRKKMRVDGIDYVLRMVNCCNKRCSACPHGPYWYAISRRHGKKRELYIGKVFMTLSEKNYRRKIEKEARDREKRTQGNVS